MLLLLGAHLSAILTAYAAPEAAFADHPFMGWSSWSLYRNHPTEGEIRIQADALGAKFKASGYTYVNIDAGWSEGVDEFGRPKPDLTRFPSGILSLAEHLHRKGLKLGIYLTPGLPKNVWDANSPIRGTRYHARDIADADQNGNTLGKADRIDYAKPGAAEYVQSCADLVASWGVDFIRMDFVGPGDGKVPADNRPDIQHWNAALKKTGRPIWLELSSSLEFRYAEFWRRYSNGWRIEADIESYGAGRQLTTWNRVARRFDNVARWARYAGPGGWNDLDALEIGSGASTGLTLDERRTTMTLWSISCAPLYIGADIRNVDGADYSMLTNPEVIAVDQSGHVAAPLAQLSPQQVWRSRNPDGTFTVALFNLSSASAGVAVTWSELGFAGNAMTRDLWSRADLGVNRKGFSATLPAHASRLLRISPATPVPFRER